MENGNKIVVLVGTGCGTLSTMTAEGYSAVQHGELLIGAERLVEDVSALIDRPDKGPRKVYAIYPEAIVETIEAAPESRICVLFSGDTGFYSGAKKLIPALKDKGIKAMVLPGISSVQVLASRLGEPWQDWKLVSAHGLDADPVAELMEGKPVFFLTGGKLGPAELCKSLVEAGLGETEVVVGQRLTYREEKITKTSAAAAAKMDADTLSVLLVRPVESAAVRVSNIGDEDFVRGSVPMTKKDVRSAIIGRMGIEKDDILWDVGAGTGGVSVEMALAAPHGRVYAIERNPEGVELIGQNRQKFGVWNLCATKGDAPEALKDLPAPDKAFIGGSSGNLREIIETILEKNDNADICVTAILIETLAEAVKILEEKDLVTEVCQITSATARKVGGKHMMMGDNPIYIVVGRKKETEGPEK